MSEQPLDVFAKSLPGVDLPLVIIALTSPGIRPLGGVAAAVLQR